MSRKPKRRRGIAAGTGAELPAPHGLEAATFSVEGDDYAVLSYPLPKGRIPDGLTPAERDVVRAILAGCANEEIARARGTSPRTVANQLRSIYAKLGVGGRFELVQLCAARTRP